MATLKKFDLTGKEIGMVAVEDKWLESHVNTQSMKDYLVALRANARQWNASTKKRSEVSHSGQKPHPQKGTGRARQGYLGAPQYKGGGRVGGPRPKIDQHTRINRKEKRNAIRHLVVEKVQNGQTIVLKVDDLGEPKTKKIASFLQSQGWKDRRILIVGEAPNEALMRSMRNIPRLEFVLLPNANGYHLAVAQHLVVLEPAVEKLLRVLEGGV